MKRQNNNICLTIQSRTKQQNIPSAYYLKKWITLVLDKKNRGREITIRIVTPRESAKFNLDYRDKQGPTNILSFPYEQLPGLMAIPLGDLVICASVLAKEAKTQGKELHAHWAHIVIHGVLYLLGYDHIKDKDAAIMESLEIKLLQKLGYENPYQAKEKQ